MLKILKILIVTISDSKTNIGRFLMVTNGVKQDMDDLYFVKKYCNYCRTCKMHQSGCWKEFFKGNT